MNTIINENGISYVLASDRMYYPALLLRRKLTDHLNQVDNAANARMDFLVSQMQNRLHVDDTLKAFDQITWVREIKYIYNVAEEIILNETIYFNKPLPFSINCKNT